MTAAAIGTVLAATITGCAGGADASDQGRIPAPKMSQASSATPATPKEKVITTSSNAHINAQVAYANKYWKNYNIGEYGDLNSVGGDCANFVSQTLIARGWKMNDEWYNHDAAGDWSPAWGYVPAMENYFEANAAELGVEKVSFDDRSKIALGDIAVFDWNDNDSLDHVEVVTKIIHEGSTIKIELASHNEDYQYRDLDETITKQHPGAIGHFWHLTR